MDERKAGLTPRTAELAAPGEGIVERPLARIAAFEVAGQVVFVHEPQPPTASGEVFARQWRNELADRP